MRIPYTDKTLFGAHVGEHGFVESAVLDEIKDYVKKGLNFVTIRPPYERKVDEKYYYEWAKYLADNHVYFIFLYALQYPPKGQVSHLTPEICARVKEIGGEYFLGDMLGETGSTYACKLEGYFRHEYAKYMPEQNAKDMKAARDKYCARIKDFVERERATGIPFVASGEATMLNSYNVEMGVDMPFAELLCANPEVIVPALRGTARAFGSKLWGTYIAHEWYGGMRHLDRLKAARLELIYKYAYMCGSEAFCIESGLDGISSYGVELDADSEVCKENRERFYRLAKYMINDDRPIGGPRTRVAFIEGNYDAFGGFWGGSALWSQFKGKEWGHSDAEHSWRIVRDVNKKRDWWEADSYDAFGMDVSGSLTDGSYDIIPASASSEAMKEYDCLIFTGWNTMTDELAKKLLDYVKAGGRLIIGASHLNTNPKRDGTPHYLDNDDTRELLGCRLTGEEIESNEGMRFIADSDVKNVKYPYANLSHADPIYSHGYVRYAKTELYTAKRKAILSDNFSALFDEFDRTATLIENTSGKGHVILFTTVEYPGHSAVYPMYRSIVREVLRAETERGPLLVASPTEVRFAIYEGNIIYLLNTDANLSHGVTLMPCTDNAKEVTLKPLELMKIRLSGGALEILSSI